jgi:transcription antitermination factor NusG
LIIIVELIHWTVARLQPQRERLALKCLALYGFETYLPRVRQTRTTSQVVGLAGMVRRRKVEVEAPLFPGYCFILIQLQWHGANMAAGVIRLLMDGQQPARVPDAVIDGIRERGIGCLSRDGSDPAIGCKCCAARSKATLASMREWRRASASSCCSPCSAPRFALRWRRATSYGARRSGRRDHGAD